MIESEHRAKMAALEADIARERAKRKALRRTEERAARRWSLASSRQPAAVHDSCTIVRNSRQSLSQQIRVSR